VERARGLAAAAGSARADVLQYHHTYLRMRTDIPDPRFSQDGEIGVADGSILSYLRAEPAMTLVAYSPLLNGAYTRPDKKLDRAYDHPGTRTRLDALEQVVKQTGATANQVVLAWLMGGEQPVVPLVGRPRSHSWTKAWLRSTSSSASSSDSCWTRRTEVAVRRLAGLDRVGVVADLQVDCLEVDRHRFELCADSLAARPLDQDRRANPRITRPTYLTNLRIGTTSW
jgi:hypothetical protein